VVQMVENINSNATNMNLNNDLTDESDRDIKQFQRNKYFYGKLLTVEDFNTEQRYLNEKRHLINKNVLGSGICCGLDLISINKQDQVWKAKITKGLAIDCCGREITVGGPQEMDCDILNSDNLDNTKKIGLYIRRKDLDRYPVPSPSNTSSCEESCCYGRVEENFELFFDNVSQQNNLLPFIVFDKKRYNVNDNVKIKLIDPSITVTPPTSPQHTIRISSQLDSTGISISLVFDSNVNAFVASFSLLPGGRSSVNSLAINPVGDVITALYSDGSKMSTSYASIISNDIHDQDFNKNKIADDYYRENLNVCSQCGDLQQSLSKYGVLLAVVKQDIGANSWSIDIENTVKYRKIIYDNPMLYDLLSEHLLDKNNPHDVSAEQIGSLKSINNVGNISNSSSPITNINFTSNNETIDIVPQSNKNNISIDLANNSVSAQKLQDSSVTTSKIVNDSITTQKLKVNWIGNNGISILENKDPNVNTIIISSSNVSREDWQIKSGVIPFIKIEAGKYRILGPFDHNIRVNDETADVPTVPAIILGQISTVGELNVNMESLSTIVAYLFRSDVREATPGDATEAKRLGLLPFLNKQEDPLYYKAINISKKTFSVLLVRAPSNSTPQPIALQWVAVWGPPVTT